MKILSSTLSKIKKLVTILMNLRGLAVTITIAFLSVSAMALLVSGSINIYNIFVSNKNVIAKQQQVIAGNVVNQVRSFIQDKFVILSSVSSVSNLGTIDSEAQKLILSKLLGLDSSFRQIVLLDSQNRELNRVSRLSNSALGQLNNKHIKEVLSQMSSNKVSFSPVFVDEVTYEPVIVIAVPIKNILGDKTGIILAEVNLKFMWDIIGSMKIGKKGLAYVVDREGKLIAFSDVGRVIKGENLSKLSKVSHYIKSKNLTIEPTADISKGILGTNAVASYVPLGQPDWAVMIELPVMEAYAPLINSMILSILVMIFSFLFAIIIGIYLSKRISQPIIYLRDATKIISKGELNTKIEVSSKNEIGDLAENFNQMVASLGSIIVNTKQTIKVLLEQSTILKDNSNQSASTSQVVAAAMQQISQGTMEQTQETEKTSIQMGNLANEIDSVVTKANEVEKITGSTRNLGLKSKEAIILLTEKATETDDITKKITQNITDLNTSMEQILQVTDVIAEITEQTNLLALNAAIEAARAGEAGRGFAVVADEVTKLATQSRSAAKTITKIIKEILEQTKNTAKTSNQAHTIVEKQMEAVSSVQITYDEIIGAMDGIIGRILEMTSTIKKISTLKDQTISSLMVISSVSEETAASSQEILASTEEQATGAEQVKLLADKLYNLAGKLVGLTDSFVITEQ